MVLAVAQEGRGRPLTHVEVAEEVRKVVRGAARGAVVAARVGKCE